MAAAWQVARWQRSSGGRIASVPGGGGGGVVCLWGGGVFELANVESTAACQVNASVDALWREEKFRHAPREKPSHFVRHHGKFH